MVGDRNNQKENKTKHNNTMQAWWQPAVMMFARMSAWIAVPVILAVFLGKWLDKKYETEPILFLVTVGLAFLISMFGLYKNAVTEYKKIEKGNQKTKRNNDDKK